MAENYPWGIADSVSSEAGTGGPQASVPADGDEQACRNDTLPFTDDGSGEGTDGPQASAPSDDDEIGCRFVTHPFGFGGGGDPTPTYYSLTECDTSTVKYTTGALTTNVAYYVGSVVELDEYEGGYLIAITTSPGTTEALTITNTFADCDAYEPPPDCDTDLTGVNPPAGMATSYTAPKINIGAGTNWEDHDDSAGYSLTTEAETWTWNATNDGWEWQDDKALGPFGYGVSTSGGKKYVYDGNGAGLSGNSNHDLKIYTKSELQNLDSGNWNLAPGRAWSEIADGACVWGFDFKVWTEGAASSRGGFFYAKIRGLDPDGEYTLLLIHSVTDSGGSHAYSTLPDTSITLS